MDEWDLILRIGHSHTINDVVEILGALNTVEVIAYAPAGGSVDQSSPRREVASSAAGAGDRDVDRDGDGDRPAGGDDEQLVEQGLHGVTRSHGEPHDELTRIAGRLTDHFHMIDEARELRCIVMVNSEQRSGIGLAGYERDSMEPLVDMFMHLKALFNAQGKEMMIAPLGGQG